MGESIKIEHFYLFTVSDLAFYICRKLVLMKFFTIVLVFIANSVVAQVISIDAFKGINSIYDELNPVLSADGKTLFFTVANHPQNVGGKKDPGDIWISVLQGTQWSLPVHGGTLINDRAYNAVAGLSRDGSQLFLLSHYDPSGGTARTQGISVSKNNGSSWGRPENIAIPYFQNKSTFLSGYITTDKGIFVFSAETYGTKGVEDIYVSINEDGRWTEPRNLGSKINTQFQELSPTLSEDGMTLYFSSNGRKGSGSYDVYSSTRLDDTWTNWSDPVNLGAPVNSEGREFFYRDYASTGSLYVSTKNSDGYGDIKFYRPEGLNKIDSSKAIAAISTKENNIVTIDYSKVETESKLVKVYGKVNNSKTGESIDAKLVFAATRLSNTVSASGTNGFSLQIPATDIYFVKIEANGYISALEMLDIKEYEMKDLEMNFKLQPVEVGTTVNLKNVLFERGSSVLLPESYPELDLVVSFLTTNPSVKIELHGHTDSRGVHADNVKLSQDRVNQVKVYLVSKGIDSKRITGKGFGGIKPIAGNDTEETRKLNRRVEFVIKKF